MVVGLVFPSLMAGHCKWSKVKHLKGPLDVKRGAVSPRLVEKITLVVCPGGGDRCGASGKADRASYVPPDKARFAVPRTAGTTGGRPLEHTPGAGVRGLAIDEDHFILSTPAHRFRAVVETRRAGGVAPGSPRLTFFVPGVPLAPPFLRPQEAGKDYGNAPQDVHPNFDHAGGATGRLHG